MFLKGGVLEVGTRLVCCLLSCWMLEIENGSDGGMGKVFLYLKYYRKPCWNETVSEGAGSSINTGLIVD